jgi:hypothetical protein
MLSILLIACLCLPLLALPGWLLLRSMPVAHEPAVERGFLAGVLGFYLVAFTTVSAVGLLGTVVPIFVRWWWLVAVAISSSALLLRWRRAPAEPPPRAAFGRWDLVVALGLLLVFGLALLHYDRLAFDQERCVIRSAMLPYHNYMHRGLPMAAQLPDLVFDRNAFLLWNAGQREGMLFVLAPWLALLQFLGFRVCFAFSHLVLAGASYIAARRLLGSRWVALSLMFAASLNPFTLRMTAVDDNLLAVAVGALTLALLLRRPVSWFWLMLPYGLFLGIRHEALLTLPGLLLYGWLNSRGRRGRRSLLWGLGLGLPLFTLPFTIYHAAMFVSMGVLYESFVQYDQLWPHSLLGLDFELRGLLGWPFAPLARSPYGPFPTLLQFPLALGNGLGLLAWSLVPAGILWLWRRQRPFLWLSLIWFLPFMVLLMVQANWTEADKMGIPNTVLTPVLLCMGAGLLWTWGAPGGRLLRGLLAAGSLALLVLSSLGIGRLEMPVDQRGFGMRPFYIPDDFPLVSIPEDPALVEAERRALAAPQLLPFQDRFSPSRRASVSHQLRLRWATLLQDLRYPGFAVEHPSTASTVRAMVGLDEGMFFPVSSLASAPLPVVHHGSGERVVVDLDLSQPPYSSGALVHPAEGPGPEPLVFEAGSPLRVLDLDLSWAGSLGSLLLFDDPLGDPSVVLLFHREPWAGLPSVQGVRSVAAPGGGRLRLSLPAGSTLRYGQFTSFFPRKIHSWVQGIDASAPTQASPVIP